MAPRNDSTKIKHLRRKPPSSLIILEINPLTIKRQVGQWRNTQSEGRWFQWRNYIEVLKLVQKKLHHPRSGQGWNILASHHPTHHPSLKRMVKIMKMRSLTQRIWMNKKIMSLKIENPRIRSQIVKKRLRVSWVITSWNLTYSTTYCTTFGRTCSNAHHWMMGVPQNVKLYDLESSLKPSTRKPKRGIYLELNLSTTGISEIPEFDIRFWSYHFEWMNRALSSTFLH